MIMSMGQIDNHFLNDIVDRIVAKLRASNETHKDKILLVCENGSWIKYEDVKRAGEVYVNQIDFICTEMDLVSAASGTPLFQSLDRYTGVVICPCSQNTLVELALGLTVSPFSKVAVQALWESIPVSLILHPPFSALLGQRAKLPRYGQKIREYIDQLQDYGVEFATWNDFCTGKFTLIRQNKLGIQQSDTSARITWLTIEDLKHKIMSPTGVLKLRHGTNLTPLAKDYVREIGMTIEFVSHEENDGS